MTYPDPPVVKRDRIGLEPVFGKITHHNNKPEIILDFFPIWDEQFGKYKFNFYEVFLKHLRNIRQHNQD